MKKSIRLAVYFCRFQYYPHLLLTIIFCLVSGCFVSFRNLNLFQSAQVLERYVNFVGIMLFTPLFMPEQDDAIRRLEQTKQTPMWQLYVIRFILAVAMTAIVETIFLFFLQCSDSTIVFPIMWFGGVSEMLFLGAIGFFVSGITNQVILGYMISVMYYLFSLSKNGFLGPLKLFQMMNGEYDFMNKMILAACILFVAEIVIRQTQDKR